MKLSGNLKDLVKLDGNKRDQLPPKQEPNPVGEVAPPAAKAGRPSEKTADVIYVTTRLQLPEEVKLELDRLFLDHKRQLPGKNTFMVNAIQEGIRKFKEQL